MVPMENLFFFFFSPLQILNTPKISVWRCFQRKCFHVLRCHHSLLWDGFPSCTKPLRILYRQKVPMMSYLFPLRLETIIRTIPMQSNLGLQFMEHVSMSYPNCYSQHGGLFKDKYLFMHSLTICPWNQNIPWTILRTSYNCFCQLSS